MTDQKPSTLCATISEPIKEKASLIPCSDKYWHYFCLSENFRIFGIGKNDIDSVETLYKKVPIGIIEESIRINNATPVIEFVMNMLGYGFEVI